MVQMKLKASIGLAAVLLIAGGLFLFLRRPRQDATLAPELAAVVDDYRKIIVLMDGADALDETTRARADAAGHLLFWQKRRALEEIADRLAEPQGRGGRIQQLARYLTSDPSLHDADKLALLDLVRDLTDDPKSSPDLRALLDNLESIQLAYREEVTRIFSQFASRGGTGAREKWDAYVASLRKGMSRGSMLAELGSLPFEPPV